MNGSFEGNPAVRRASNLMNIHREEHGMSMILRKRYGPALLACSALIGSPAVLADDVTEPGFTENVQQETNEMLNKISSYSAEQKDEALDAAEDALASIDENIDEVQNYIDEKGSELSADTQEQYNEMVSDLRDQRSELQQEYRDLAAASAENWQDAKSGFTDAFRSVQQAWDDAVSEIRDVTS